MRADEPSPLDLSGRSILISGGAGALGRVIVERLCCHAGVAEAHPVQDFPLDTFDRIFNVNVRAAFLLARAASRRWVEHGLAGQLLFTTSWVQDVPWPEIAPYSVSKAALKSLARSFARELAPHGSRANAIAPGTVAAGMAKQQWDNEPSYRARAKRAIPLGHLQPPESVAEERKRGRV